MSTQSGKTLVDRRVGKALEEIKPLLRDLTLQRFSEVSCFLWDDRLVNLDLLKSGYAQISLGGSGLELNQALLFFGRKHLCFDHTATTEEVIPVWGISRSGSVILFETKIRRELRNGAFYEIPIEVKTSLNAHFGTLPALLAPYGYSPDDILEEIRWVLKESIDRAEKRQRKFLGVYDALCEAKSDKRRVLMVLPQEIPAADYDTYAVKAHKAVRHTLGWGDRSQVLPLSLSLDIPETAAWHALGHCSDYERPIDAIVLYSEGTEPVYQILDQIQESRKSPIPVIIMP